MESKSGVLNGIIRFCMNEVRIRGMNLGVSSLCLAVYRVVRDRFLGERNMAILLVGTYTYIQP